MPAIFNGLQLNPIQSVSVSQQTEFLSSGKLEKYLFNISVKGKIVASQSATTAAKHAYILAQQQTINSTCAYSSDSETKDFSFTSRNGTGTFSCSGRIKSVSFDEGIWVDYSDYSIEMEADSFIYNGVKVPAADVVNLNFDESWTVEVNDEDKRFTKVSHKISAKCKDSIDGAGWIKAKAKVDANIASTIPSDISGATSGTFSNPHNKKLSYRVNITNGEVSADIELSYHNPATGESALATHEQTITEKSDSNSFRGTTSISGTIAGLNGGSGDRYGSASGLWETVKAALIATYAAITIVSTSESHDEVKGIINYDYQVEDYPKPTDGSKSKKVNITEMGALADPPDIYVIHQTIYGGGGPLFQDIGIKKVHTKTVTIEAVSLTSATLDTLEYAPDTDYIIESDNIQKNLAAGKTTRTTVFIWSE